MPARTLRLTQKFAIAALLTYAAFFIVSQSFYTADDPKLVAVLSWAHYGSVLPRAALWYASILEVVSLVIGLVGVAFHRRWGAGLVLIATIAAFAIVPLAGLSVFTASARVLGGITGICIVSILVLSFLARDSREL